MKMSVQIIQSFWHRLDQNKKEYFKSQERAVTMHYYIICRKWKWKANTIFMGISIKGIGSRAEANKSSTFKIFISSISPSSPDGLWQHYNVEVSLKFADLLLILYFKFCCVTWKTFHCILPIWPFWGVNKEVDLCIINANCLISKCNFSRPPV